VVETLSASAPLIFLRESESSTGQIDVRLTASADSGRVYLNYTQAERALRASPARSVYAFSAPRLVIPSQAYASGGCDVTPPSPPLPLVSSASAPDIAWAYTTRFGKTCGSLASEYVRTCLSSRCASSPSAGASLVVLDSVR
jgi:hypothetical protein